MKVDTVLQEINDVMEARKDAAPESSYVSQLLHEGSEVIVKKIIEEAQAIEPVSKEGNRLALIRGITDVWFHSMVLLTSHGLRVEDVLMEMKRRQNISGIDEKVKKEDK